jgi:Ca2+-binding RTX toxin-like protein
MTTTVIVGGSSAGLNITTGYDVTVEGAGIITAATADDGIDMTEGGNIINVNGSVYGAYGILEANTGTGVNTISIGESGVVVGVNYDGITLYSTSQTVLNAGEIVGEDGVTIIGNQGSVNSSGTILGQAYGVEILGAGDKVANSGTIEAGIGIGIYGVTGTSTDTVDNSGTIDCFNSTLISGSSYGVSDVTGDNMVASNSGHITADIGIRFDGRTGTTDSLLNSGQIDAHASYGIEETGAAVLQIANTGTIWGQGTGIAFGTATGNSLDNSGTIEGNITLGSGGELDVTNSGHIAGQLTLGTGNDSYDGTLGSITKTVSGGAGNDLLIGGPGRDILDGGTGSDTLYGYGGNDVLSAEGTSTAIDGGDGNDTISMGAYFNASDTIEGGDGNDVLALNGDYSGGVTFVSGTVEDVERITVANGFTYNLTTDDDTVAAGATLRVDASALTGSNVLKFNGSAETDGRFILTGGAGADVLVGGSGNDWLYGNGGANQFTGGGGADRIIATGSDEHFIYTDVSDSTSTTHDIITGFNASGDVFDLDVTVTGINAEVTSGALRTSAFDANLASAIGAGQLAAGHAVLFTPTVGNYAGHTILVVDANGVAGYQAGADYVFDLVTPSNLSSLATSNFI